jgi:uncharacterized protein (DUF2344 family)
MTNTIIPEKIHLIQIHWVKQNNVILSDKLAKNPSYNFQMAHNMMHNLEREIVKIRLFLDMSGELDYKTINQGGNYEVDFLFQIADMKDQYQIVEEKPVFNGLFVTTLLAISFSTMRGMLFTTWKDTVLRGVILPVITVPELLKSTRKIV